MENLNPKCPENCNEYGVRNVYPELKAAGVWECPASAGASKATGYTPVTLRRGAAPRPRERKEHEIP